MEEAGKADQGADADDDEIDAYLLYEAVDNETPIQIAAKVGMPVKELIALNKERLPGLSRFQFCHRFTISPFRQQFALLEGKVGGSAALGSFDRRRSGSFPFPLMPSFKIAPAVRNSVAFASSFGQFGRPARLP